MLLIADNLQILNPAIAAAVSGFDPQPIQDLVRRCRAAGAQALDINVGPLPREAARRMRFVVEAVQAVTDLPLVLDTVNPEALAAGLAACRNRTIINGFSLEPARLARILPLAARWETDIVGYLLRPDGQVPEGADERLALAVDLHRELARCGVPEQRLIVDPVVAPATWEDALARNRSLLEVIRRLPEVLGYPVRTIAGLSNLTAGRAPRGKRLLLENAFVPMLAAAGLDLLLVNAFHAETLRLARAGRLLATEEIFTWEALG